MAGRFRFSLEVVRRVRRQAQDAQRRAVADAVRTVTAVENRIEQLTRELADTMDRTRDVHRPGRLDIASLRGHQFYRGHLHRRILESGAELSGRQTELQRERAKLAEATKQLKVIEKLREKHWQRHLTEVRRAEQAAFDEAALQVYRREQHGELSEARVS